ncbi:MAG: MurT ligase domain-containing protein [Eubacteriales bacterium]|nr:MurT ligase domain-containing protein [Eubacteriales bacterium]
MKRFYNKTSFFNNLRRQLAFKLALFTRKCLMLLGRKATSMPGRVALKIYPRLLADLCNGRPVIVVSGTNGKTSTLNMLVHILETDGRKVIANRGGANMPDGFISAIAAQKDLLNSADTCLAFEVDEAWFAKISNQLQADLVIFTNLYRDQADRYGDPYATRKLLESGLEQVPEALLVTSADEPLVASLGQARKAPAFYFGLDDSCLQSDLGDHPEEHFPSSCPICLEPLSFELKSLPGQGKYHCAACGFKRPALDLTILPQSAANRASFLGDYGNIDLNLTHSALYELYNAAAAALSAQKWGVPGSVIREGLESFSGIDFRNQQINLDQDRAICLNLVKNPVGMTVALESMAKQPVRYLLLAINNRESDGRDISWLSSVDYSALKACASQLYNIVVSGSQSAALKTELIKQGFDPQLIHEETNISHAWQIINDSLKAGELAYVLPNYTAMLDLQSVMH